MASSSLTVSCARGTIRTYGGTMGSVKSMRYQYTTMTLEQFLAKHPYLSEDDFQTLSLTTKFRKS